MLTPVYSHYTHHMLIPSRRLSQGLLTHIVSRVNK